MRIVILYNEDVPSPYSAVGEDLAIASVLDPAGAIQEALESRCHTVALLGLEPPLFSAVEALRKVRADVIFNLFEGFPGSAETEWQLAEELEAVCLPFTGACAGTLALCLDKARTKRRLAARRVPTPPFQLLHSGEVDQFLLDFPVIVKPLHEDASHGLSSDSVVYDTQTLVKQLSWVETIYGSPVLVEGFLSGREFNVSVLGDKWPKVFPPTEIVYAPQGSGPRLLTYAAKWLTDDPAYCAVIPVCPAQVPEALRWQLETLAIRAHKAVGSPPYARVDLREDGQGKLHVLEVNPNPDLSADAGMALQAKAAGLEYRELIQWILEMVNIEKRLDERRVTSHAT